MKADTGAYWRRIAVGNLIASAIVLFAFSGSTFRTPAGEMARNFGIALLFATCISPMLGVAMPRLAPWLWRRTRFPFNWVAITLVMAVLAILGTIAAIGVLVLIDIVPRGHVVRWFEDSVRVSIVVTLTIGIFITGYEMMRARVAQSAAEAQLASLESRVQPHILFNTLNSIAALVHEDPAGAERMTTQLASLMRSSLDGQPAALVPLDEELRVLRDYLEIERVRFGGRLRYRIDAGDGASAALVPRLSLQTLVENSVKYAVSPRREGATIVVAIDNGDGRLRMRVEDDGPGFDGRTLPPGHGLALLRTRLAALFADRAVLRIESAPGKTIVAMNMPLQRHE
jgi:signal transduction histidine kinase